MRRAELEAWWYSDCGSLGGPGQGSASGLARPVHPLFELLEPRLLLSAATFSPEDLFFSAVLDAEVAATIQRVGTWEFSPAGDPDARPDEAWVAANAASLVSDSFGRLVLPVIDDAPLADMLEAEEPLPTDPPGTPPDPWDPAMAFLLHSNPGADQIAYLDFTGHGSYRAYSVDSDRDTFNDTERSRIRQIWQRVSEDYAPFGIDITTEEPDVERLKKSGSSDTQ